MLCRFPLVEEDTPPGSWLHLTEPGQHGWVSGSMGETPPVPGHVEGRGIGGRSF